MHRFEPFIISVLFILMVMAGCQKENYLRDANAKLDFSVDTLLFDTVFTTIGTVTRKFKVYNKHNQDLLISSISLAGGQSSAFRINADGRQGPSITDIQLAANDSLYIFVEIGRAHV